MGKRKSPKLSKSSEFSPRKKPRMENNDVKEWDINKMADFLSSKDLDFAVQFFIEQEINGQVVEYMTEDRLEKMGIEKVGERLRVLEALRELTGNPSLLTPCNQNMEREAKVFNDPIHGHIEFHPLCMKIMDTPQFQRLRYIRQLGGCYFVFPGASHNRFEHSIGVGHLARELCETLQRKQPELNITNRDVLCVQIAGLCHDLGHGPFSHMFDGRFIPAVRPDSNWKHEEASVQMFEYLVQKNNLIAEFEKYGLTEQDRTFIKEQIAGPREQKETKWKYAGRDKNKSFLYEIISNKRNGIDVDKWDYFARDCHHLGIRNNFDHNRFMKFARVLSVENENQICSRDKEVGSLYAMFHSRMTLHRRAYQHKITSTIEIMITEALIKANDHIFIQGKDGAARKMSECIDDMEAYTRLTDYIFHQILHSTAPELEESRNILNNIECRKLYKCIGQSRPQDKSKRFNQSDLAVIKKELTRGTRDITTDQLHVQLVSFDYGMKNENPIDHVRFYMKSDPSCGVQIRKDEASALLPSTFYEQYVRVYCKSSDPKHVEAAKCAFSAWCARQDFITSRGSDLMSAELTPLKPSPSSSGSSNPDNNVPRTCLF